jgi:hypothetical protein
MEKAMLICLLVAVAVIPALSGQSTNSKNPCGVRRASIDEMKIEWRLAAETDTKQYLYNTKKKRCTDGGVLRVWIKVVEKDEADSTYQMQRTELKCRTDQMRLVSVTTTAGTGAFFWIVPSLMPSGRT